MKKYSCSYNGINPNFVISDIESVKTIKEEYSGYLDILYNLLSRGCPCKPSTFLINNISEIVEPRIRYYIDNTYNKEEWYNVIKGFGDNNPASAFYHKYLKCDDQFSDVYKYFLPECPMSDIIYYNNVGETSAIQKSATDFYDPIHGFIIEIDGQQHNDDRQRAIDKYRNVLCDRYGIKIQRVPTRCSNYSKDDRKNILKKLSEAIHKKHDSDGSIRKELDNDDVLYLFVIRFQIILIELFRGGIFDFNNNVELNISIRHQECYNNNIINRAFELAYNDIQEWIRTLAALNNSQIDFPVIKISDNSNIILDVDTGVRYDQNIDSHIGNHILIKCRDDYFRYDKNANTNKILYAFCKNYYIVRYNSFRFDNIINNDKTIAALRFFLKNIFGFDDFRPKQVEIIISGFNKKIGTIGLLPTGSGKSICFQLVSLLTPGVSIVISPLRVLMDDQCNNLLERNCINAFLINSDTKEIVPDFNPSTTIKIDNRENIGALINLNTKILYISPERFLNEAFCDFIKKNINILGNIAIDEVHCLSEWGHDFRTSYLLIFRILKGLKIKDEVLLIGTSATSSPRVTEDIISEFKTLKFDVHVIKGTSLKRPELFFDIVKVDNNKAAIKELRRQYAKDMEGRRKILVFAAFASDAPIYCEDLSQIPFITRNGVCRNTVYSYTGKMHDKEKNDIYNDYKHGKIRCIVATKAFGMGVDIFNIRHTIHIDMSSSIESMYQEMGRAGRDGKRSKCTIIYVYNQAVDQLLVKAKNDNDPTFPNIETKKCGSLSKQFYLMKVNTMSPLKEAVFIDCILLKFISGQNGSFATETAMYKLGAYNPNSNNSFEKQLELFKPKLEKYLYKLYLLGIIPLWNITYSNNVNNPIYSNIIVSNDITVYSTIENLEKYIHRYNRLYKYSTQEIPHHEGVSELFGPIYALCKWTYDNFQMTRFRSLMILNEIVKTFSDSDIFMDQIESYFNGNESIDKIISTNETSSGEATFDNIEKLLTDNPEEVYMQIQKYIAEYNENPVLAYIEGITALRLQDKEHRTQYYRNQIIIGIRYYGSNGNLNDILNKTFECIDNDLSELLILIISENLNDELMNNTWGLLDIILSTSISEERLKEIVNISTIMSMLKKINDIHSNLIINNNKDDSKGKRKKSTRRNAKRQ